MLLYSSPDSKEDKGHLTTQHSCSICSLLDLLGLYWRRIERLWFKWYPLAFLISMKSLILVSCPVINQNKRKINKNSIQLFHTDRPDIPSWGFFVPGNCYLATRPCSCQTANTESMTYRKETKRIRVGWICINLSFVLGSNTILQ